MLPSITVPQYISDFRVDLRIFSEHDGMMPMMPEFAWILNDDFVSDFKLKWS